MDGFYLRDLIFYGDALNPGLLMHFTHTYEAIDSFYIQAHFPLSIPGRVSQNIAHNPEVFATLAYSLVHRKQLAYSLLNTDGNVDMYRWEYV